MRNLRLICILFFSMVICSCSTDDTNDDPAENPTFQARINGGTFSDFTFALGVYKAKKSANGNTLSIDLADVKGNNINLFLNGTDSFDKGTVKQIGNVDTHNFVTHAVIKGVQPTLSYFSSKGTIKITNNREHPSKPEMGLISGEFDITADALDGNNSTTIKGSFNDLEYTKK